MLARLRISPRLVIAIAFPLAMLIALAGYDLSTKWAERVEMGRIGPLADGVAKIGQLVHELQRERGASSLFIGSKGAQMRDELPGLRKRTDEQRLSALAALSGLQATAVLVFALEHLGRHLCVNVIGFVEEVRSRERQRDVFRKVIRHVGVEFGVGSRVDAVASIDVGKVVGAPAVSQPHEEAVILVERADIHLML